MEAEDDTEASTALEKPGSSTSDKSLVPSSSLLSEAAGTTNSVVSTVVDEETAEEEDDREVEQNSKKEEKEEKEELKEEMKKAVDNKEEVEYVKEEEEKKEEVTSAEKTGNEVAVAPSTPEPSLWGLTFNWIDYFYCNILCITANRSYTEHIFSTNPDCGGDFLFYILYIYIFCHSKLAG